MWTWRMAPQLLESSCTSSCLTVSGTSAALTLCIDASLLIDSEPKPCSVYLPSFCMSHGFLLHSLTSLRDQANLDNYSITALMTVFESFARVHVTHHLCGALCRISTAAICKGDLKRGRHSLACGFQKSGVQSQIAGSCCRMLQKALSDLSSTGLHGRWSQIQHA